MWLQQRVIELSSKSGLPKDVLPESGLTRKQLEQEMRASRRADKASTYRPRDETADEKRDRKEAVRDERKVGQGS
jgi:hypothetical protein